ncbi:MAG: hypothetical protein RIQ79_2135 [Verrucomicrobiota bacterium]
MATITASNPTLRCRHCQMPIRLDTYEDNARRQTRYRLHHPEVRRLVPTQIKPSWAVNDYAKVDASCEVVNLPAKGIEFVLDRGAVNWISPANLGALVAEKLNAAAQQLGASCATAAIPSVPLADGGLPTPTPKIVESPLHEPKTAMPPAASEPRTVRRIIR